MNFLLPWGHQGHPFFQGSGYGMPMQGYGQGMNFGSNGFVAGQAFMGTPHMAASMPNEAGGVRQVQPFQHTAYAPNESAGVRAVQPFQSYPRVNRLAAFGNDGYGLGGMGRWRTEIR